MNDRIRELIGNAKFLAEETTNKKISANAELYAFSEKFAELIVRECIEVIDSTSDNTKLMRVDPYQKIIWAIEEHFGVE